MRRDPHARLDLPQDPPQGRLEAEVARVVHAAVLDVEPVKELPVALLEPADVVVEPVHVGRMAGGERLAEILLDLLAKGLEAHRVDRVLEPGRLAVGAVAEVALHLHDRFRDREHVFRGHEAEPLGQRGKRLRRARRHAHAAAGEDVVAEDLAVFVDDEEAEVVGVDVGAVVFGQREGGLELSGKIRAAINGLDLDQAGRLDVFLARGAPRERLLAGVGIGEPDLVVGPRARGEMPGELVHHRLHLVADRIPVDRRRAAHDVALDVAAGGERGHLDVVDPLHEGPEIPLHDAVVLDRLPRREPDRAVAHLVAQVDRREQLVGRELSARHAGANHERDIALALLPIDGLAGLAVVLLVGAVVLEQLDRGLAEAGSAVGQLLGDVSSQVVAGDLGQFDGGGLGGGTGGCFV